MLGIVAVGVVRESRKFRAPIYRAHRAVIFATAQLSCYNRHMARYQLRSNNNSNNNLRFKLKYLDVNFNLHVTIYYQI